MKSFVVPSFNAFRRQRRDTRVVSVGSVDVGGLNPLRLQSMTTTPTDDVSATVEQTLRLAAVGCEIVRITAPTVIEAQALEKIKNQLLKRGCAVPLVADIHFRPDAALVAADFVEKVRINPGNYVDGKAFKVRDYSDDEYAAELARLEEKFTPLVLKLKKFGKALRIGTNHGSLSDRILNRYGDTPLGMVESAVEYLKVCIKNDFHSVIFSMKASNPRVMVAAYRLLATRLDEKGWNYPFHLGVTEAGYGDDGRIKSAVGMGALLEDGIGDTVRVSLTEDPEFEIPVARALAKLYDGLPPSGDDVSTSINPLAYVDDRYSYSRRVSRKIQWGPIEFGGDAPIRILSSLSLTQTKGREVLALLEARLKLDTPPEMLVFPFDGPEFPKAYESFRRELSFETSRLAFVIEVPAEASSLKPLPFDALMIDIDSHPNSLAPSFQLAREKNAGLFIRSLRSDALLAAAKKAQEEGLPAALGLTPGTSLHETRGLAAALRRDNLDPPIILLDIPGAISPNKRLATSAVLGGLLCDGVGDALYLPYEPLSDESLDFAYNFLQATQNRSTKTDFVSCPSCGRTLFDLQSTTDRIKKKLGHLKGVKIAIMGCIVNGPGEMADADFGYVGGGPGKINLYVGKACVEKSIPAALADDRLIELIKSHGRWVDKT